jgi:hypothetical protein
MDVALTEFESAYMGALPSMPADEELYAAPSHARLGPQASSPGPSPVQVCSPQTHSFFPQLHQHLCIPLEFAVHLGLQRLGISLPRDCCLC